MAEPQKFYGVMELTEHLGVSEDVIRAWLKHGELAYHQLGRRVVVSESDLQAFLAARRRVAATA